MASFDYDDLALAQAMITLRKKDDIIRMQNRKIDNLLNERHVYKTEMNRLRRKITRVYEFVKETWKDNPHVVEVFKDL